jgi:lysozyme
MDLSIIRKHEGLRLNAYLCPAGVWTIGWGNTLYENGSKVKQGDVITRERADALLLMIVNRFKSQITPMVNKPLTTNQWSALVSFVYNIGVSAFQRSTMLKKVNANPSDPTIRDEFMKWNKANGAVLHGLTNRRRDEANLYFKP